MPGPDFDLATYYPIFAYLVLLILFAVAILVTTHVVGPTKRTPVKQMPYESGMDPIGDARQRFDVKFYLVAIMFLVFDVELLFLYPWAVIAYGRDAQDEYLPGVLHAPVFWCVLAFIVLLFVAYVYDWKKGVFKWR
jgi:NADH-quinone oxidoreductase subunit A